jgi:PPOX class probable F420-dependent enzyme
VTVAPLDDHVRYLKRDLSRDGQGNREAALPQIKPWREISRPCHKGNGYLSLAGQTALNLAELSEKAKRLLKGKNFAFVATVNRDGSAQLTPTWVDTDGENVLVNTAMGRMKTINVTRDPRVTVGVFDQSNPYEYVSIRGKVAKQVKGKEADDHIDKLSLKYVGAPKYKRTAPGEERVILVIRPSKVI